MKNLILYFLVLGNLSVFGQINFTANDQVPIYDNTFGFGVNPGSNSGWDDEAEADIAAGNPANNVQGVGCNTLRPPLPEWFLESWGYDIRLDEFQYFESLGIRNLTVFLGVPSADHQDPNFYCPNYQSTLFDNMYLPIWDNGANGTPINDDNYYAKYVYQTVNIYKDHVKFWEIWNEPDFDYSASGFLEPGQPGNWYENVPDPCDYKLRAPVYHYIRLLRISYEVIKYVDPEAFVAVGGLGYESFLDIILRHSDNPDNGIVNASYPLTGGAYFDALSYHSYPHFSLKEWDNDIGDFVFSRHSDAATQEITNQKDDFTTVLENYGYDGNTYPQKTWLITEGNVPAENFNPDYFGSIEGQRNFIIKAVVTCMSNNILQYHVFKLAEDYPVGGGVNEFDRMGLYENIDNVDQYDQVMTEEGMAFKTTSDAIGDAVFDHDKTQELSLPDHINGAAFQHTDNSYTYVLWAKTSIDDSELASANYSFPASMNINLLEKRLWNFSQTNDLVEIGANNIALTGAPIFLHDISITGIPPIANFDFMISQDCAPSIISFFDNSTNNPESWNWTFPGGVPNNSSDQHPIISYPSSGIYEASLLVSNGFGSHTYNLSFEIGMDITSELNAELCSGDEIEINGTVYNESNPTGTETFPAGSTNACDSIVIVNLTFHEILESETFATICDNETYAFNGEVLSTSGTYTFETTSNNGCDSIAVLYLNVESSQFFNLNMQLCSGDEIEINGTVYNESNPTGTETFPAGSTNACDSIVVVNLTFNEILESETFATICNNETYAFNGEVLSTSGTYTFETTSNNGCDSIAILYLNVEPTNISNLNMQLCSGDEIEINGTIYNESNPTGTETFPAGSTNACDSIVIVNLLFNEILESETFATICDNETYLFNGATLSTSGTYTFETTSNHGCDSTAVLYLNVESSQFFNLNTQLCSGDEIEINGTIYNESNPTGTETFPAGSTNACDSIVIVNLTFHETLESETFATICDNETYLFNGDILSASGTYTFEITSNNGCDSIAILYLNVEPTNISNLDMQLCAGGQIEINGIIYNEVNPTGIETISGGSINGCDSIVIINLTFDEILEGETFASICDNEAYSFYGAMLTLPGTYTFETATSEGCDSLVILYLTVEPTFYTTIEATILQGETYTFGNSTYDVGGTYFDILIAQNGCDSIIELKLIVDQLDATNDYNNPKLIDLQSFPNPFSNQINISFRSNWGTLNAFDFYDTNGQLMSNVLKNITYQNDRYYLNANFATLPKGVYWCQIHLEEGIFTQKLIKL